MFKKAFCHFSLYFPFMVQNQRLINLQVVKLQQKRPFTEPDNLVVPKIDPWDIL